MRSFLAALRTLVLPAGATSGRRLVLDGVNGQILCYDGSGNLRIQIGGLGGNNEDAIEFITDAPTAGGGRVDTFVQFSPKVQSLRLLSPGEGSLLNRGHVTVQAPTPGDPTPGRPRVQLGDTLSQGALIELDAQRVIGKQGSNRPFGLATLVGGAVVVSNIHVTASTLIFLSRQTPGGTLGHLDVGTRTPGTSFTITSTSGTETSTVAYMLVDPF